MATVSSCWSDLHADIFHEIVRRLNLGDLPRFCAVCRSWHAFYRSHLRRYNDSTAQIPWLVLPSSIVAHDAVPSPHLHCRRRFYSLTEQRTYDIHLPQLCSHRIIASPINGFLITVDNVAADLHLINLLTRAHIALPPTSTLPNITTIYSSSAHVTSYVFTHGDFSHTMDIKFMTDGGYVWKATMCLKTNMVAVACAKLKRNVPECLAFARPGDTSWTALQSPANFHYEDLIFHKGRLCGINPLGTLATFELNHPSDQAVFTDGLPIEGFYKQWEGLGRHLVESVDGDMFSVARKSSWIETVGFEVYRLDESIDEWKEVKSLGDDIALVVLACNSRCLMVQVSKLAQVPRGLIRGNCVYFYEYVEGVGGGIKVFNLGNESIKQMNLNVHFDSVIRHPLIWFTPCLF